LSGVLKEKQEKGRTASSKTHPESPMHQSALDYGKLFFRTYFKPASAATVVDIGAQNVNGSLQDVCLPAMRYVGVDFVPGKGVDIVLDENDPYKLPFADASLDVVVCSSVFEHSEFFWLLFLEILRVLKPSGLFYLNVPSNGFIHRYPVDAWRFYPDAGLALVKWARRSGYASALLESFIGGKSGADKTLGHFWNDFVAVFVKDEKCAALYPQRMMEAITDYHEGYNPLTGARTRTNDLSPDLAALFQAQQGWAAAEQRAAALGEELRLARAQIEDLSAHARTGEAGGD
jgi:SAM-dependent methyltransferase